MPMWSSDFDQQPPQRVAGLMDVGSARVPDWTDAELEAVLRHQLNTPIETELVALGAAAAARFKAMYVASSDQTTSMSSIFASPDPPLPVLEMIKEFAKSLLEHPDSALPREVAGLLYWSAIAAALVCKNTRITRLKDDKLLAGLSWALERPWIEPRLRQILQRAMDVLETNPHA